MRWVELSGKGGSRKEGQRIIKKNKTERNLIASEIGLCQNLPKFLAFENPFTNYHIMERVWGH